MSSVAAPNTLYRVHKLMIGSGIALSALFAVRETVLVTRGAGSVLLIAAAVIVAVGLGVYLRAFIRKISR